MCSLPRLCLIALLSTTTCLAEEEKTASAKDLFYAIQANDLAKVKQLLAVGVDPNLIVGHEAPIHMAIEQGSKELVKLLAGAGAKLDTPEQCAVASIHFGWLSPYSGAPPEQMLDLLISLGADPRANNDAAMTQAAYDAEVAIMKRLKSLGLKPKHEDLSRSLRNNPAVFDWLLQQGLDPKEVDEEGLSLVHEMARAYPDESSLAALNKLASLKLPLSTPDKSGRVPASFCCAYPERLKWFLDRGTAVESTDLAGTTLLMSSAAGGNILAVKLLLDRGADLTKRDNKGRNVLDYSLKGRAWDAFVQLYPKLRGSCDASAALKQVVATAFADYDELALRKITRLLLPDARDLNQLSSTGSTLLHDAVLLDAFFLVEGLIQAGAALHTKDSAGRTAADLAALVGNSRVTELFVKHGLKSALPLWLPKLEPSGADNSPAPVVAQQYPFFDAILRGDEAYVQAQLQADPKLANLKQHGLAPFSAAVASGQLPVAKLLRTAGAQRRDPEDILLALHWEQIAFAEWLYSVMEEKDRVEVVILLENYISWPASLELLMRIKEKPKTAASAYKWLSSALKAERLDWARKILEARDKLEPGIKPGSTPEDPFNSNASGKRPHLILDAVQLSGTTQLEFLSTAFFSPGQLRKSWQQEVGVAIEGAVKVKNRAAVKWLLERMAPTPEAGKEALSYALYHGDYETALYLLRQRVPLPEMLWSTTPLHRAVENGDLELVMAMLDAGAKLSSVDDHGASPLALAEALGEEEIAKVLREAK